MTTRFQRAYGRFVALTDRLGKRLRAWERQLTKADDDAGAVSLPPEGYVETYKAYRAGMATVLAEDRERQKLEMLAKSKAPDGAPMTPEEFKAAMLELEREALAKASEDDLARALATKRTDEPS